MTIGGRSSLRIIVMTARRTVASSVPPLDDHVLRAYTCHVSAKGITDELVQQVTEDLRTRYALDDEDVRALGARLADAPEARSAENLDFAERFTTEHRETFERLSK